VEDIEFHSVTLQVFLILREGVELFAAFDIAHSSRRYAPLLLLGRDDYVQSSRNLIKPTKWLAHGLLVMGKKKILLIDDDNVLWQSLAEQLELHEEFEPKGAGTAKEGLNLLDDEYFDVILLDVGLPDMDGREACRLMRQGGVKSPIIMLTRLDTDVDMMRGLDVGANDYINKPFRFGVLLARIRAQLSRYQHSEDTVFSIGPYTFKPSAKMLIEDVSEKKVRLTEKETCILKFLYRAGDKVVGRDILLGEVWGYIAGVTTHTLETHVYRLRQKIELDPSNAEILVTEPGGYRLVR
jgi:DNA-binding response OmpR family regulator